MMAPRIKLKKTTSAQGMTPSVLTTTHGAADAPVRELATRKLATRELATSRNGKGTTSVVPFGAAIAAALAAEGAPNHRRTGSRFLI
jgi:hypothetical protein